MIDAEAELLAERGIARVLAPNPGPFTLSGTNSWVVGSSPAWVVDPGPAHEQHLAALRRAVDARGGLGGVALTHGHGDHSEGAAAFAAAYGAPLAAASGQADVRLCDGERFGPFEAVPTPGHAADHFALLAADACFSGDAVLGEGSVFITPYDGSLASYLAALERLRARDDFTIICPGHGPTVADGHAKLREYGEHRLERERALVGALDAGLRGSDELLDSVWSDAPEVLRLAAAVTLAAHLDKLAEEDRLPGGVERPDVEWLRSASVTP
ncbi:MAG TPA: MBL fold metallo-hydrolase [Solirubrobacteraceae bacterium]|nr:MBL fold metallo-hydrolase [Solirubrobacteraceae bacterium]